MIVLGILAASAVVGIVWAIVEERINRDKPFDRVIADIPLKFDPVANTIQLHESPTKQQLDIIEAWARDPRQPARRRSGWRVLKTL